jgi:hypothetical protein
MFVGQGELPMRKLMTVVVIVLAFFVGGGTPEAQTRPTQAQLELIMTQALGDARTVTFARPQILGFREAVVTHQVSAEVGDVEYFFAVTTPRLQDGLVFFTRQKSANAFRMHRTDAHMRRVASAQNDVKSNAGLVVWAGVDADRDFARQLGFWASWHP